MGSAADRLYEQLLVVRCQTDDSAFAELIERFQRRLACFVRSMLPESRGVDDVLQEIWLDVYRGLKRLNQPAAFPTWLFAIARRKVVRAWNGQAGQWESLPTSDVPDHAGSSPPFSQEDVERIPAALDRLSPPHREVLVLRFLEDMSYEDISRITGSELGTIRSRLHYAKKQLRRILEQEH